MKYVIVYWSRYGNGKKVVHTLADKLKEKSIESQIFTTDEANPTNMPDADLYVFSAPAEAFNVQKNMRKFMRNLQGMEDKKFGIINTHGLNKNWLYKMDKLLTKKKMEKTAEVDFKVGKDAQSGNALEEGWETKLNEFVKKL